VLSRTRTDAQGRFTFHDVRPGSYVILVVRADFNQRREVVQIAGGESKEVTIVLEINPLNEEVTITSEAGLIADARNVSQAINVIDQKKFSIVRRKSWLRLLMKSRA